MIVYLVESKVPEVDIDQNTQAESSLSSAIKTFGLVKAEIIENGHEGWCSIRKIKLAENLTNKQLILAIFSQRGFAENQELIKNWSTDQ